MRLIRSILAVLLVACLAVVPAAAKAAAAVMDASAAADQGHAQRSQMAGMPDCYGMAHMSQQSARTDQAQHKQGSSESCPDCDKHKSCSADACQLKCFKVFGSLSERLRAADVRTERYGLAALLAHEPVSRKPRTPPPRS